MDKIVHFEVPWDDEKRSQKFYEEIFGWHMVPMPGAGYTIVHTGPTDDKTGMNKEPGFINGGMFKRDNARKTPVLTIDVQSIDETIKKIESMGGKMVGEKQPVFEMGFVAYFTDCEGNLMGLWENKKA